MPDEFNDNNLMVYSIVSTVPKSSLRSFNCGKAEVGCFSGAQIQSHKGFHEKFQFWGLGVGLIWGAQIQS